MPILAIWILVGQARNLRARPVSWPRDWESGLGPRPRAPGGQAWILLMVGSTLVALLAGPRWARAPGTSRSKLSTEKTAKIVFAREIRRVCAVESRPNIRQVA